MLTLWCTLHGGKEALRGRSNHLSLCVSPLRAVIRRRLDFVVAVHGLQGRLRLAIARLELGPKSNTAPYTTNPYLFPNS